MYFATEWLGILYRQKTIDKSSGFYAYGLKFRHLQPEMGNTLHLFFKKSFYFIFAS